MVICEPAIATPWIDKLEAFWPREKWVAGVLRDKDGNMCAVGALVMGGVSGYVQDVLMERVILLFGRTITQINDTQGYDAVVAALRTAERSLHGRL